MSVLLQLKFLGLSILVLAEIAASVAYVNYLVRFKSGIDNNETLRRLWSKPEQIIFQPVSLPILLSWIIGIGVNSLVRNLMIGFLQLIDTLRIAGELSLAGDFAVTVSGTAAGAVAGTLLYVIDGGTNHLYQILGTVIASLAICLPRIMSAGSASVILIWVLMIIGISAGVSYWIKSRGVLARVPTSPTRDLRMKSSDTEGINPNYKVPLLIIGVFFIFTLVSILDFLIVQYIKRNNYETIYLAEVLRDFAGLMVLITASLNGIILTNTCLSLRYFHWQWETTLMSMLLVSLTGAVLFIVRNPFSRNPDESVVFFVIDSMVAMLKRLTMFAAAGYLGSSVYLGVLARAASQALDPGIEGQSELIVDDDSEYEIEA